MSTTFPKETLRELASATIGETFDDGFTVIKNDLWYNSRWSVHYEMIFSLDDKFYRTTYARGATENQDEGPYDYSPSDVEVTRVYPVIVEVVEYREAPDDQE